jgi:subtilisin-like proprotein convertase family protein
MRLIRRIAPFALIAALVGLAVHRSVRPPTSMGLAAPQSPAVAAPDPAVGTAGPLKLQLAAGPGRWVPITSVPKGTPIPNVDPRFPHRVRNTLEGWNALARNERVILLRNAFVDTANGEPVPVPEALRSGADPGTYIVQSRGEANDAFRQRLALSGARIISYIPKNAYLVQATPEVAAAMASAPEIGAVLANEPHFKLEPRLAQAVLEEREVPAELLLTLLDADQTLPQVEALGAKTLLRQRGPFGELVSVEAPRGTMVAIARLPGVTLVEEMHRRKVSNDRSGFLLESSEDLTNVTRTLGLTGSNVLVNVNDSGVDATHPDIAGRVFATDSSTLQDPVGHGTHVVATIAGNGSQSGTVTLARGSVSNANFSGRASSARVFVLPIDLTTGPLVSDVFLQETYATTNLALNGATGRTNAPLSNNSWGYPGAYEYNSIAASYDAASRDALPKVTGDQPILFIFAAGNEGDGGDNGLGGASDSVSAPATAKNVISVGALESRRVLTNTVVVDTNGVVVRSGLTPIPDRGYNPDEPSYVTNRIFEAETDSDSQIAGFSSRGNTGIGTEGEFGRFKPDVVAPGSYILSARSAQWRLEYNIAPDDDLFPVSEELVDEVGPFYRYESGTSMAAPAITGILAQLQEYYELRQNNRIPPEGYKAILINSAEVENQRYQPDPKGTINYAGWGRPSVLRSLNSGFMASGNPLNGFVGEPSGTNNQIIGFPVVGRSNQLGLATGESRAFRIKLTNPQATNHPVRITLVWTDPPGNPAAAIKLVNDLDLVVTNATKGEFFFGNDFEGGTAFTRLQSATNTSPTDPATDPFGNPTTSTNDVAIVADMVNNVERIVIPTPVPQEFVVIVKAHRVNVNARQMHPRDMVQDAALVIRSDGAEELGVVGTIEDAETVPANVIGYQRPALVPLTNGLPLFNERVGANSPLFGGTNGSSNQWKFYVFTNTPGGTGFGGTLTNGSNVAFVTFFPPNLGRPRAEDADLDLYVSRDPGLTNLVPSAIASSFKSTLRGGTEYVAFTNSPVNGEVYYVGVKAEDQQAAEYTFVAVSSVRPFGGLRPDGNLGFLGIPIRQPIPDGTPANPGLGYFMALGLSGGEIRRVFVEQTMTHQNFPDLIGNLFHDNVSAILNNHGQISDVDFGRVQWGTNITTVYDDASSTTFPGSVPTDGPGSLIDYLGEQANGVWLLQTVDDALGNVGRIDSLDLIVQPNDLGIGLVDRIVQPGQCELEVVNVPANASRLTIVVTNFNPSLPLEVHIRRAVPADPANPDASEMFATLAPPGGSVSLGIRDEPPLVPGRYFVSVCNPNNVAVKYQIARFIEQDLDDQFNRTQRSDPLANGAVRDAATTESRIAVNDTRPVAAVEVGLRITHPRLSDLAVHLVNPQGQRMMVTENRGTTVGRAYGGRRVLTNYQHVAMTYDPFESRVSLYVDGRRIAAGTVSNVFLPISERLSLANDPTRGFTNRRATIALDDMAFWRRPLSTNEVRSIHADGLAGFGKDIGLKADGMAALWPLDSNGNDLLGVNDLALLGFSEFTAGQVDSGLRFSGVTAEARSPVLPLDASTGFTLEGWVQAYPSTTGIVVGAWGHATGLSSPALLIGFDPPYGNGAGSISAVFTDTNGVAQVVSSAGGTIIANNISTNFTYAVFSDRTNLTAGPIKFAVPPYSGSNSSPVIIVTNSFEAAGVGLYAPGEVVEGWTVETNTVAVLSLPTDAQTGSRVMALGDGAARFEFDANVGVGYRASVQLRTHPLSTNPVPVAIYLNGEIDQTLVLSSNWLKTDFRFRASTNRMNITIAPTLTGNVSTNGEPLGVLLDTFTIEQVGAELSYQPEDSFKSILGQSGAGEWTLEVTDARGTTVGTIDSWELRLTFMQTNRPVVRLTNGVLYSATIAPGENALFRVDVPLEARAATNTVFTDGTFLPLFYSDTGVPSGTSPGDVFANANPFIVDTNLPPILPRGQRYYMALINPGTAAVDFAIRADINIGLVVLTNGVPFSRTNSSPGYLDYYAFDVSTNALAAVFEVPTMSADVDLFLSRSPTLPRRFLHDYASTNSGTTPEVISLDTGTLPVQLAPGRWFLSVATPGTNSSTYSVVATELAGQLTILTNNVPLTLTNEVSGSIQYFALDVPEDATAAELRLTELTGNVDLYLKRGLPLVATNQFDYASRLSGTNSEVISIDRNSTPVPLAAGRWYVAVQAVDPAPVAFTITALVSFDRTDIETLFEDLPVDRTLDVATSRLFRFVVEPGAPLVLFEIYGLTGQAELVVSQGSIPNPRNRIFTFPKPGLQPELVVVTTNDLLDLSGIWYLAVGSQDTNQLTFTVRASAPSDGIATSRAAIELSFIAPTSGSDAFVDFNSVPGRSYQLQSTGDLAFPVTWTDVGPATAATGYTLRLVLPFDIEPQQFYRVIPVPVP